TSWRYVFLAGLIPAAFAFFVRLFIKEPERWKRVATESRARISELFSPQYRMITLGGFCMAVTALITWWSGNAFIPIVAKGLASREWTELTNAGVAGLPTIELMGQQWIRTATNAFNLGGLIGTLLTIPAAKVLGR